MNFDRGNHNITPFEKEYDANLNLDLEEDESDPLTLIPIPPVNLFDSPRNSTPYMKDRDDTPSGSNIQWEKTRYRSNTTDSAGEEAILSIYKRKLSVEDVVNQKSILVDFESLQSELW